MNTFNQHLKSSRTSQRILLILLDIIGLILVGILSIWLKFDSFDAINDYIHAIIILPIIAIPIFIRNGLYHAVIRYIGLKFAKTLFLTTSIAYIVWFATIYQLKLPFPGTACIISYLLAQFFVVFTRLLLRQVTLKFVNKPHLIDAKRVIIWGAGTSGQQLLDILKKSPLYEVTAFLDDTKTLHGSYIDNIKIYQREDLSTLIENTGSSEIFIAIPSLPLKERKKLIDWLEPYKIKVSTLPTIDQVIDGQISFNDIREVEAEDLLGREPIPPKPELLAQCIQNKTVFVSGAGGSIGSELCRQIIKQNPQTLILYEASEFALYNTEKELTKHFKHQTHIIGLLGSVLDQKRLNKIFNRFSIDTIYHAAAYKHVPIVEHNIYEGIKNNTFGTLTLAKIAAQFKVSNFVLISTDKAVRPCNFMGASKRMAEMVLQALQMEFPETVFTMVRFGNVLGSSGSVIPLFKQQIAQGGPVTVTHPEVTRYFMTIPEAALLVIQAGSLGQGGDVFVLDMGKPIKIVDLATRIIKLSGLEVVNDRGDGDIEIKFTGLRPGEKLYEELLIGDNAERTLHPRILRAHDNYLPYSQLMQALEQLEHLLEQNNLQKAMTVIKTLVPGFTHSNHISDWLYTPTKKE